MAKLLFHTLFHSGIQESGEKWTIMDQGSCNKCSSFENDIQLQLGRYSYLTTCSVNKVAFGKIKIIFHHKEEIQTGCNHKCCKLKRWLSKILNSRTIQEQVWKKGFFWVHFQHQKKIQNNSRYSRIGHPAMLWMKFDASPSYFSPLRQLRVPASCFANSNVSMHFFTYFSNFLVEQWQFLPCKVWMNFLFKKHSPRQIGHKLEGKALTSPKNYIWTYSFLSLILLLLIGFKGHFLFSFHVNPDLDILFERLAAQIVVRAGLGTQL